MRNTLLSGITALSTIGLTVLMSMFGATDSRILQLNGPPSSTPYETSLELPARASLASNEARNFDISPVPRESITQPGSFSAPYRQIPSPPTSTMAMDDYNPVESNFN